MNDRPKDALDLFHAGELAIQMRDGTADKTAMLAPRMIQAFMPEQHRDFYAQLPFILIGATDATGQPWATAAFGPQGFITSPNPQTLVIGYQPLMAEPLKLVLQPGAKIGLLGIEVQTRRRNRMNGHVLSLGEGGLVVRVEQSYGNCPQYIQRRELSWRTGVAPGRAVMAKAQDKAVRRLIEGADVFYIASRSEALTADIKTGVDVSHRGGKPGFVRVDDDGRLSFPDFSGNRMFNTLGNIQADARVGLFFPNFETGEAVFLTGQATIDWDSPRVAAFAGAERIVDVVPDSVVFVQDAIPIEGVFVDQWPMLEKTGDWEKKPS